MVKYIYLDLVIPLIIRARAQKELNQNEQTYPKETFLFGLKHSSFLGNGDV